MSENKMEVDLHTPTENLKKHCQEITPDNPTQPERKSLLGAKKVVIKIFNFRLPCSKVQFF